MLTRFRVRVRLIVQRHVSADTKLFHPRPYAGDVLLHNEAQPQKQGHGELGP